MQIKIGDGDSLSMRDGRIVALFCGTKYFFEVFEVDKAFIITNDLGPYYDDMCLALKIGSETDIFVMSEHPSYTPFLFEQFGKSVVLDYAKITEACACTDNAVFLIYSRP